MTKPRTSDLEVIVSKIKNWKEFSTVESHKNVLYKVLDNGNLLLFYVNDNGDHSWQEWSGADQKDLTEHLEIRRVVR